MATGRHFFFYCIGETVLRAQDIGGICRNIFRFIFSGKYLVWKLLAILLACRIFYMLKADYGF